MTTNRTDKHKLFQMLDNIGRRDKQMVEEMNGWIRAAIDAARGQE